MTSGDTLTGMRWPADFDGAHHAAQPANGKETAMLPTPKPTPTPTPEPSPEPPPPPEPKEP